MTAAEPAVFLADILADPADDAPRMAYADWLQERGDPRGEFIAVQLRLAALEAAGAGGFVSPVVDFEYARLKRRERELLAAHEPVWFPWRTRDQVWAAKATVIGCCARHADYLPCDCLRDAWDVSWRRGFVAHVGLTLADFEEHAAALFRAAPVEGVRLADREPIEAYGRGGRRLVGHGWRLESWADGARYPGTHECPAFLEPVLLKQDGGEPWAAAGAVVYPTADAAHAALSAACVAFGRDAAGLPALPAKEAARA
jgi:uncharacterized protein (TIGR02996 family)